MERQNNKSRVMGYKIAIVNNANLSEQMVGEVRQFEYASKRLQRAIRKARKMARDGYKNVVLFGQRENGEHFPISYRKTREFQPDKVDRTRSRMALRLAMPGTPIEDQKKFMALHRVERIVEEKPLVPQRAEA